MATLLVLPGWLPTPHLLTLPSLPAQDASMVLGKAIQGGAAAAEVPEHLHKVGCFSSSWWERPRLGKQSPPGGTFKTCFLAEGFCLEQVCVPMKGKLQIYPEDNVKG